MLYGSLILAAALFLTVAVLAYINRGSNEVFDIVRPMVLAILAASAYLGSTILLSAPIKQEAKSQVIVYRKQDRVLIPFTTLLQSLPHQASQIFLTIAFNGWDKAVRDSGKPELLLRSNDLKAEAEFFLDVLEVAIFEWLRFEYGGHWDVTPVTSRGLSSSIRKNEPRPDAADRLAAIPVGALEQQLARNQLVMMGSAFGRRMEPETVRKIHRDRVWAVPADSQLKVERSRMLRTIRLSGPYSHLQIDLRHIWNLEGIGGTAFSERVADGLKLGAEERKQALGHVYEVSFAHQRPRLKRWAPEAIKQAAWVEDMAKRFAADFEWEGIREDLEKANLSIKP